MNRRHERRVVSVINLWLREHAMLGRTAGYAENPSSCFRGQAVLDGRLTEYRFSIKPSGL